MSQPIILPNDLDVVARWQECVKRDSVICWRALSNVLLAYARLEFMERRYAIANDLLTLSEVAQQHAINIAPFNEVAA